MHQRPRVGRVEQHVVDPPGRLGLAGEPEPADLLIGEGPLRSLTDDQQPGVVAVGAELGERVDEHVNALNAEQVPDVHEDRRLARLQPRMGRGRRGPGVLGDRVGDQRRRRRIQPAVPDGVVPYRRGRSDQAVSEAIAGLGHPLVVAPVELVAELDQLVLGDQDLSPPAGRRPGQPGRGQGDEIGVYLTRDQHIWLLRP